MVQIQGLPILLLFASISFVLAHQKIDPTELKCLVCEKTLEELQLQLAGIDPNIQVDAGGYRLDAEGNLKKKTVSMANSEVHISDMLEKVCEKMDDYVRARYKSSGQLIIMKLLDAEGKMNVNMSEVDLVQDNDLNKSLKYYCEMLIEEHEDAIIESVIKGKENIDVHVCSLAANYCDKRLPQDEL